MKNTPAVGELIEIDEEFQNEYIKIKNTKFQSFLEAELTFVGMFLSKPVSDFRFRLKNIESSKSKC